MTQYSEYTIGRIEQLIEDHVAQLSPSEIARRVGALLRNGASHLVAEVEPVRRGVGRRNFPVVMVTCKTCGKRLTNRAMANHIRWEHPEGIKKRGPGRPRKKLGTGHYPVRMVECKICGEQVKNRAMGNHMRTQHGNRKKIR